MENFIKESKTGFDFAYVSSYTRIVNANRLQIHTLAYNIFNWFRRLALSANMRLLILFEINPCISKLII